MSRVIYPCDAGVPALFCRSGETSGLQEAHERNLRQTAIRGKTSMNGIKAVIFDIDDTLYPERQFVFSGMRAVAAWAEASLALPADDSYVELCGLFCGGARGNTFDLWLKQHAIEPAKWVPAMVQVYREHSPRISPFSGTARLLQELSQQYRLGLVSDGDAAMQRRKLAALGLKQYFCAAVFSPDLGPDARKPSPLPFERILHELDLPAGSAVYVADNPAKDFRAPRQLGMTAIRIRHPQGLHSHLEPCSPADAPHCTIVAIADLSKEIVAQ
jgi:putative hydrolase of the HAD superfamily